MTESEFHDLAEACLHQVEEIFEQAFERDEMDVECSRSGNVLTIEFVNNGSKMIVNSQAPMQEMWLAARSGGFHYRYDGQHWLNTRDGSEFFATLSRLAAEQSQA
jgi:CyaY protein